MSHPGDSAKSHTGGGKSNEPSSGGASDVHGSDTKKRRSSSKSRASDSTDSSKRSSREVERASKLADAPASDIKRRRSSQPRKSDVTDSLHRRSRSEDVRQSRARSKHLSADSKSRKEKERRKSPESDLSSAKGRRLSRLRQNYSADSPRRSRNEDVDARESDIKSSLNTHEAEKRMLKNTRRVMRHDDDSTLSMAKTGIPTRMSRPIKRPKILLGSYLPEPTIPDNPDPDDGISKCTVASFEANFRDVCQRSNMSFIPEVTRRVEVPVVEGAMAQPRRTNSKGLLRSAAISFRMFSITTLRKKQLRAPARPPPIPASLLQRLASITFPPSPSGSETSVPSAIADSVLLPRPPGSILVRPFTTFTVTFDKYNYFIPKIQVETEIEKKAPPEAVRSATSKSKRPLESPDKVEPQGTIETVKALYIRGWKVDLQMMENLQTCWLHLQSLRTINLWQAGLTRETLHLLSSFLPLCANLTQLILDNNPVPEENYHELLQNSFLQYLSLKHCSITDTGARSIAMAVGTTSSANTRLLTLDLAGNFIRDPGAICLADALRTNRTLLVLSLANNKVGDAAAFRFAEALSKFSLTHEEVVERRRLISIRDAVELAQIAEKARLGAMEKRQKWLALESMFLDFPEGKGKRRRGSRLTKTSPQKRSSIPQEGEAAASVSTPDAKRKKVGAKLGKEEGGKRKVPFPPTQDGPKISIDDVRTARSKRRASNVKMPDKQLDISAVGLEQGNKMETGSSEKLKRRRVSKIKEDEKGASRKTNKPQVGKRRKGTVVKPSVEEVDAGEDSAKEPAPAPGPSLLEDVDYIDGRLWLTGNRILVSLNLSRNQIGERGLRALLEAVQFQTKVTALSRLCGKGLMRLCVHKNRGLPADSKTLIAINLTMHTKDPTLKWSQPTAAPPSTFHEKRA